MLGHCGGSVDYWGVDVDADYFLPCENIQEITRLMDLRPRRCETTKIKNQFERSIQDGEQKAFSDCKTLLTIRLQKICDFSRKKAIS